MQPLGRVAAFAFYMNNLFMPAWKYFSSLRCYYIPVQILQE